MQTRNKAFDDLANLLTNAFGAAKSVGDEARAAGRSRVDKIIADMDLVTREEFDVVKAMAAKALAEVEALKAEMAGRKPKPRAKKPTVKKATKAKKTTPRAKTSTKN